MFYLAAHGVLVYYLGNRQSKASEHVCILICVFLCIRMSFYIIILYPYWRVMSRMLPNHYVNASFNTMTMYQAGIHCLSMPQTRPSGDCPNMIRGNFTLSYLRNQLLKWLAQACSISYQLYIGSRILSIYIVYIYIYIYYIYIHRIFLYIHCYTYTMVSEQAKFLIL